MDVISRGQMAIATSSLEGRRQMLQGHELSNSVQHQNGQKQYQIMTMRREDNVGNFSSASSLHGSTSSIGSLSSSDLVDDATSSTSCSVCSSFNSNGTLFELSDLMAQLPIKKGLSRYYEGKSQSFTSLSRVTSTEDLAKKKTPLKRRRNKKCNKFGGGKKDRQRSYTLPKATIYKGASKVSVFSLSYIGGKGSLSAINFPFNFCT